MFKTIGIQGGLRGALEEIGNVKFSFIYGSYAKARETSFSDIDLMVIGNPDEDKLIKELDTLEDKFQREINYKLYTLKKFKKEIEGKLKFVDFIFEDEQQKNANEMNSGNYEFVCKNGEIRNICLNVQKIPRSKQSIATLNDITKIKKAERELKARMDELERWHKLTVDRELKMVELKKRIKELETSLERANLKRSRRSLLEASSLK